MLGVGPEVSNNLGEFALIAICRLPSRRVWLSDRRCQNVACDGYRAVCVFDRIRLCRSKPYPYGRAEASNCGT